MKKVELVIGNSIYEKRAEKLKIYHLASFSGNIGDVANHESFYVQLQNKIQTEIAVTKDEIRYYYQSSNLKRFDASFVEEVNQHDMFVLGGGNFFELCWNYSENGTTFNISNDLLKQINIPILINGIGVDDNKGVTAENIEKFREFLKTLFDCNKTFFTVRNDGSYDIFKKYFPEYSEFIVEIPDFGFFVAETSELKDHKVPVKTKTIGFNIALDMPQIRYSQLNYETYLQTVASEVDRILAQTEYHIYLFAHIQSDYQPILDLLSYVTSKYARTRISISSLIQGKELETFGLYKECEMVFAMRFHANVCSIALGVPTFGMVSYPKHEILYEKIGLPNRRCSLDHEDFVKRFKKEVESLINEPKYISGLKEEYKVAMVEVSMQKENMFKSLLKWMELNGLLS